MLLKTADDKSGDIHALEALLVGRTSMLVSDARSRTRSGRSGSVPRPRPTPHTSSTSTCATTSTGRSSTTSASMSKAGSRRSTTSSSAGCSRCSCARASRTRAASRSTTTASGRPIRDRRPIGIPSPVEQNRRHIKVLEQVIKLGYVELPRRIVAIKPTSRTSSWCPQDGLITRPRKKLPDLDSVMKVDQFRTYLLNRDFPDRQMLKIVGSDTLEAFGRQLVALHRPARSTGRRGSGSRPPPRRRPWRPHLPDGRGWSSTTARARIAGTCCPRARAAIWRQRERRMLCLDCGAA